MSEFDQDTGVVPDGRGVWRATVTDRWNVGSAPNGGYIAAIALAAAAAESPHPDPFAVTTNFLRRAVPGSASVRTDVLRSGRSLSTVSSRVIQDGVEVVRQIAVFGDLDTLEGPTAVLESAPQMPAPDVLPSSREVAGLPQVMDRFDYRVDPTAIGGLLGSPTGAGQIGAWMRFGDGREPDLRSLVVFADSNPPAVLNLTAAGWVPTVELSVHIRQRPALGWLQGRFRTRYLIGGYLEEDGELWDSRGELVALSRQFARVHQRRGGGSRAAD